MKANVHPITIVSGGMGEVRVGRCNRIEPHLRIPLQVQEEDPILFSEQSSRLFRCLSETRSGQFWENVSYAALGVAGLCGVVLGFI